MGKAHSMRVEVIAGGAGKRVSVRFWDAARGVERVAHERVARGREVNADLMRPPGLDLDLHEGTVPAVLEKTSAGSRPLPRRAHGVDRAEKAVGHEPDSVLENRLASRKSAGDEGAVGSLHIALPGPGESAPRLGAQREEHDSRSPPSEPVEGRGARVSATDAGEKGVLEKASARKRWKPRGLGDAENVFVLVKQGEARGSFGLPPGWTVPDERLSRGKRPVRGRGNALDEHQPAVDAPLPFEGGRVSIALAQVSEQSAPLRRLTQALAISKSAIESHGFRPTTYATQAFSSPPRATRRKMPLPFPVLRSVPSQSTWTSAKPASNRSSRSSGRVQSRQS